MLSKHQIFYLQFFERLEGVLVDVFDFVVSQVEHLDALGLLEDAGFQFPESISGEPQAVERPEPAERVGVNLRDEVLAQVERAEAVQHGLQRRVRDVTELIAVQCQIGNSGHVEKEVPEKSRVSLRMQSQADIYSGYNCPMHFRMT